MPFLRQAASASQLEQLKNETDFSAIQKENARKELVTKDDLRETELRLKYSLLKWQLGIAAALAAIMAKGFGWLGF